MQRQQLVSSWRVSRWNYFLAGYSSFLCHLVMVTTRLSSESNREHLSNCQTIFYEMKIRNARLQVRNVMLMGFTCGHVCKRPLEADLVAPHEQLESKRRARIKQIYCEISVKPPATILQHNLTFRQRSMALYENKHSSWVCF